MADIPDSISIPSSNSSKKRTQETANYKEVLASMANTMADMKCQMELQNDSNLLQLKKEADLISLLEAAEAKVDAVKSKPNPTPTQKLYLEVVETHFRNIFERFRGVPILPQINNPTLPFT